MTRCGDMLQVRLRSMQHVPLIEPLRGSSKPVLLKRTWSATLHGWICSTENGATWLHLPILHREHIFLASF